MIAGGWMQKRQTGLAGDNTADWIGWSEPRIVSIKQ